MGPSRSGFIIRMALAGREMFEFPGNRWESLHDFQGMQDMYLLTDDTKFRDAFTHIGAAFSKGTGTTPADSLPESKPPEILDDPGPSKPAARWPGSI